ncbi:MAG TPA: PP2C family protein-serine/threonine phosphatase, partial [Candidatus Eisenbacteria bacterium]
SLLYLVPVGIAAWRVGRGAGMALSFASAASWIAAYLWARGFRFDPRLLFWNATVEQGVYLTVALTLSTVRCEMDKQRALAAELRNAYAQLDDELRQVGDIQLRMLPTAPPPMPGWRIVMHYSPSRRSGGDYYDFFPLGDGRVGFVIADASGHGTPAAVVMAMIRVLLHTDPEALGAPEQVLHSANLRLSRTILTGQFVTACYSVFECRDGRLEYSMAGHPPPLVIRVKSGAAEEFSNPTGPPLGLFDSSVYTRQCVRLEPGDAVLFYTDGLTEAQGRDGELFGVDRVKQILSEGRRVTECELQDRLLGALRAHTGAASLPDDLTFVLARWVAPGPSATRSCSDPT